ncbi:MAG: peptidoglycan LD-endopeptidase LytH [Gaiellaceae bacterium]|nr:peptidoglycan LD-endopeptidase LytH [Gaiellaceae bacterium]
MRGALLCLIAAGVALGCVLAAHAADQPYVQVKATIAQVGDDHFGNASSRRQGDDSVTTDITEDDAGVEHGDATTSAGPGVSGFARVRAVSVTILGGRVTAGGVRRVLHQDEDGTHRGGAVYDLHVDGQDMGDVNGPETISLAGGGRVVLNTGDTGLRVVTDDADVRIAVVSASVVEPTATATATPTPTTTATTAPSTSAPPSTNLPTTPPVKRRKAPSVKRRLTGGGYAFPVYGKARVADNFGAARAKPIEVHEGVDIFAPFGSPVVAVRDGRIDHVGTLPISGNRLWLHTENGDAFFYAHLSAFSNAARNGARVKAGTVLGFVGNTGDAEPTPPHLHFEVHPGGENQKAVNPYRILTAWQGRRDVPTGAWLQAYGPDTTKRPGALVAVRDFIAE